MTTIKSRVIKLEKMPSADNRNTDHISAWSERELKEKLEKYRRENPGKPEPCTILRTIIKSRADLENQQEL